VRSTKATPLNLRAGGQGMAERDFSYFVLLGILGELEISLNIAII